MLLIPVGPHQGQGHDLCLATYLSIYLSLLPFRPFSPSLTRRGCVGLLGLDLSRLSEHQISSFGISLPEATRLYNRIHSGDLVRLVDDFSFDIPQQHDSFSSLSLGVNSLSLDLEDGEPLPSDELPPF
eukprot:m.160211 g.160211  ORF g.160211 m.160211 type:complete len:128 (-) comp14347_c0_seq1:53-436(-)